jgi:polyhydroxyalkanoate synthase
VSWRNVKEDLAHVTWDDYLDDLVDALDQVRRITKVEKMNVLGFCIGGTLLASALAVLEKKGRNPAVSLTLLTTLLDFTDVGEIRVYIDKAFVAKREKQLTKGGLVPGGELATAFSSLRANDLVWSYVVNNYLKGKAPAAFDLLYWNADGTNLPGPMYVWYLRNMYLENNLREPSRLSMCGTPVDLGRLDMPSYVLATQEDHIVPWRSAYRTMGLVGGKSEFVLGASGHIAGVINPASKNKRSYWTGGQTGDDAERWLATAESRPGSWWTHWADWLKPMSGKPVAARKKLGNATHKPIEAAPGRYVKVRTT